jgi:phage terminase Nu1 subunit (DNA packaging protein)
MSKRIRNRPAPLPPFVRLDVLASWVGVSRQTISQAAAGDVACPRRKDADGEWEYQWPQFNVWYHRHAVQQAKAAAAAEKPTARLDEERIAKWRADRELSELELKRRQGDVMDTADHLRLVGEVVGRLRAGLLAFPSRAAPRVLGMTDVVRVETALMDAVAELMGSLGEPPAAGRRQRKDLR